MAAMSTIALGMAGLQLAGASQDATAMRIQADQEKNNAEINSRIMKIKEKEAEAKGSEALSKFRRDAKKFLGSQKVAAAASGVDANFGSAAKAREESELLLIDDESRIKNNAMLEAWGYKTQGQNILLQGEYNSKALRAKAGTTLLGGALQAGVTAYSAFSGMPSPSGAASGGGGFSGFSQVREV